ncbi:MAG: DPP IV N-terminal domain-containing protein [Candidatus Poribacteria bacterium]|nr:DPP IV N-terminal domain-containing protein [Candidatus Poribacteria bacterium]
MRFGSMLGTFIGFTVILLSGELWLIEGIAAQKSRIVFSHLGFDNFEIYVMDADGGNRENLSNHPVHDVDPDWSPDGTKIAFVSNRNDAKYQIYVMDADGTNQIRLTDGPRDKWQPDWSPDGGKIAFSVDDGVYRIDVMDVNGDNRVVLEHEASAPSWSPDGGKIAFISRRDKGREIYVIGTNGQGLERLTRNFLGGHSLSFSPDGRRIASDPWHGEFNHIYVMGADGKNPMRLSHNQEHHTAPTWSPDGQMIAYVVSDDGNPFDRRIHLMTANGKYIKQLSKVREGIDDQPDFSPVGLAVSPVSKTSTTWGTLKKMSSSFR